MKKIIIVLFSLVFLGACVNKLQRSQDLVEEAIELIYKSDFELAMDKLDAAIQDNPENFEAWYYRASCFANQTKYLRAIDDYSQAIVLNPNYAVAYFNRGQMKFYLYGQQEACSDWKEAERLGMVNVGDKTRFCN